MVEDEKQLLLRPFANFEAGKSENPFLFMEEIQAINGDFNGLARDRRRACTRACARCSS